MSIWVYVVEGVTSVTMFFSAATLLYFYYSSPKRKKQKNKLTLNEEK